MYTFNCLGRATRFNYRKAMPQQEKGGITWLVAVNVVKMANGRVVKDVYESRLPSLTRAKSLAKILNLALE